MQLDYLDWTAFMLATLGAINLGLVGLGQLNGNSEKFNLLKITIGAVSPQLEALFYILIGLAGLYLVYLGFQFYEE